jgi:murein L,D-transpeptidase YcbB/YkuD
LLARGVRDARVPRLRERLTLSADLDTPPSTEDPYWFDEGLEAAVRRAQSRHGLPATGRVDETTRAALNVPVAVRIRQLAAALERWRRLPRELGIRHVEINTAEFMLRAFERDQLVLEKRVVIGRPFRATPALSSALTQVVLNPDWTVPHRLAVEDLLPLQQEDADFLSRKRIRVYAHEKRGLVEIAPAQIDWARLSAEDFPYTLRQDPGPGNSLGRIKFVLPNSEDIYLHDTPTKRLFDLPVRVFSSGCVRVEDPLSLAEWVLADEHWSVAQLEREIASERTRAILLAEPVPLYLVYWTSWVAADGTVQFRNDVYERDGLVAGLPPRS